MHRSISSDFDPGLAHVHAYMRTSTSDTFVTGETLRARDTAVLRRSYATVDGVVLFLSPVHSAAGQQASRFL